MKRALITGVTGQDGAYLSRLLLEKGYRVHGTHHRPQPERARLRALGVDGAVELLALDVRDSARCAEVIAGVQPDEVYNLAAQSQVAASFRDPLYTSEVDAFGVLRMLEALRQAQPAARFCQASSSDMFGAAASAPQDESTPFRPLSPYAIAKLFAHWTTVSYRENHRMFACSAILFNHESPLRERDLVTRKVSESVARIKLGLQTHVELGNLDARRDWGFAGEYVEGMWRMLQSDEPDDYVLATGRAHTVRELATLAFAAAGIEIAWEGSGAGERARRTDSGEVVVTVSPSLFRPAEVEQLIGDAGKARRQLGWQPRVGFAEVVAMMVEADLRRLGEARG